MRITIRLTRQDEQRMEEMAEQRGLTTSDLIRELIRTGHERQAVADALQELRAVAGSLAAHKGGSGSSQDIAEIRRIVTLIARAMPSVARHIS